MLSTGACSCRPAMWSRCLQEPCFPHAGGGVAEVDSVLTTGEVAQLLADSGASLAALPEEPLQPLLGAAADGRLYGYPGGSGGYLEHVFRWLPPRHGYRP